MTLNERISRCIAEQANTCHIGQEEPVCGLLRDCQKQLSSQVEALKLAQSALTRAKKFAEYCHREFENTGQVFPSKIDAANEIQAASEALAEISKHLPTSTTEGK